MKSYNKWKTDQSFWIFNMIKIKVDKWIHTYYKKFRLKHHCQKRKQWNTKKRNCNTTRISNSYNQGISSSFSCISASSRFMFWSDDETNKRINTHHPHMQHNECERICADKNHCRCYLNWIFTYISQSYISLFSMHLKFPQSILLFVRKYENSTIC